MKMRVDCRLTLFAVSVYLILTFLDYFLVLKQFQARSLLSVIHGSIKDIKQNNASIHNSAIAQSSPAISFGRSTTTPTRIKADDDDDNHNKKPALKYYIIAPPEYTDNLLMKDFQQIADSYYQFALNEESVEIWLHRAFQHSTLEEGHTVDSSQADVFLIAGYFHLNQATPRPLWKNQTIMIQHYKDSIVNKTKPHLLLTPTWNPGKSRATGVGILAEALQEDGVNMWSVGIERNKSWQGLLPSRIVPVPYVVKQSSDQRNDRSSLTAKIEDSVFYTGDARRNAQEWGGCFRENMILPLVTSTLPNIDVRIVGKKTRLPEEEYNHLMITSEYCLILCGDTPTSRSLTAAMVSGCIPILVGSRLRGLCEPPCVANFGWSVAGEDYPHLAFANRIPWNKFPEVNESEFTLNGEEVLRQVFVNNDKTKKEELRSIMAKVREGWIYGWGNPVTSTSFGQVHKYLLEEFTKLVA